MAAYYNEIDPKAAAWLRELIERGHIADGDVDERSIVDVPPDELRGFTQCHFFAGIGVWSYALRSAGWTDDRPVWTGSCPCQPFSAAGAGGGFDDERHLWPHWHHLISQCQPAIVFGEQVASKDGLNWLDLVHADMEATGYAVGAADMCAAGFGAPHIRQRLWFVGERLEHAAGDGRKQWRAEPRGRGIASGRGDVRMADANQTGRGRQRADHDGSAEVVVGPPASRRAHGAGRGEACGLGNYDHAGLERQRGGHQAEVGRDGTLRPVAEAGQSGGLADADHAERRADGTGRHDGDGQDTGREEGSGDAEGRGGDGRPSPTDGFWRDADWLFCRDGKWRPVEPGAFPLAHGSAARVGRLRGYGNAIAAPVAQAFIESVMATGEAQ